MGNGPVSFPLTFLFQFFSLLSFLFFHLVGWKLGEKEWKLPYLPIREVSLLGVSWGFLGASSGTLGKAWIDHRVHPPPAPCACASLPLWGLEKDIRYPARLQGCLGALAPAAPTAPSACIIPKNTSYLVFLLSSGYVKYWYGIAYHMP